MPLAIRCREKQAHGEIRLFLVNERERTKRKAQTECWIDTSPVYSALEERDIVVHESKNSERGGF